MRRKLVLVSIVLLCSAFCSSSVFPQQLAALEIHYINVGWGGSVLVKGPDGTTVLMEAGNTGKGTGKVVPYLQSIGLFPASGLDYTIAGHQHCDHLGGLDEVINAGYNVRVKNYYNGSSTTSTCVTQWNAAAATTLAGASVTMPVGTVIPLGGGATLTAIAVNGSIIGGGSVAVSDENDRSIAVLIKYGGFDYLWASDLGGGTIDQACTGRSTTQTDVESSVIQAISPGGAFPMISAGGIDVLHVNHHGSESSSNSNWMNKAAPTLAVIGVGAGQTTGWDLPRIDTVEHVLLAQSTACITAPPAFVLQTEDGSPSGSLTSFAGFAVGDIKITTDGVSTFSVDADGQVTQGVNEVVNAGLPRTFALDDAAPTPDTQAPSTSITSPAPGATVSASTAVSASATDNVGVTKVEFYLDNALSNTDTTAPYSWTWDTTTSANGAHTVTSKAYDGAGNIGDSLPVSVTVNNVAVTGLDISNWKLVQANSAATFTFPAGTIIPDNGYLVLGRDATQQQFEAFWRGGTPLPSNAVYINLGGSFLVINGSENYQLNNAAGTRIDGKTISMSASGGQSIQRIDPCLTPGKTTSWNVVTATAATPGTGAGAGCGIGVVINEFSDAIGTGNFIYEFVELHYDK